MASYENTNIPEAKVRIPKPAPTKVKITVEDGSNFSEEEKQLCLKYVQEKYPDRIIKEITLSLTEDGKDIDVHTTFGDTIPFDRIRRITGYLVGNLGRFNNGKRAEESQRVKHGIEEGGAY